ncbi:acyl-CoA dehydrogenase [Aeromicrobium sp. 50.2.37]|uniref:acyl-CoA dehydrogenase n=1 Tax=Aeromicrobium sp. 50.2.37 TaxID=2969305 RepID=UPI0021500FE1|nr:acyl-CoA dehydrogenase [Aeromicrobium sp. 50.2.37]MCR4512644.1 acyl-CoA dehydrogenase [Aeromicrobium sp. 50.2.37]
MTTTVLQKHALPVLDFLLGEWLELDQLLTRNAFEEHSLDSCQDYLAAASDIAAKFFEPAQRISDLQEPRVAADGSVVLPPESHAAWEAYRSFGFLSARHAQAFGGLELPRVVDLASHVIFGSSGANLVPSMLTEANAALILAHGTERQKRVFAHAELEGRWTGTMAMSESEAGSSLSDITTRASVDGSDHDEDPLGPRYRIRGTKMWISGAEHDLTDNIVHLVLAKIPRPDGTVDPSTRGISLFIVPKLLVDPDGNVLERNDVSLIGLNHKLGNRGIPNTSLAFGAGAWHPRGREGAIGYLVGAPGDGLRQMFHMMNAARTEIGLAAASVGLAGYALSLDYAKQRRQGRPTTTSGKDTSASQVPIVEHADVRRMLLAQKAYTEGAVALALYAARLMDDETTGSVAQAEEASELLDLLTPVVKSWPSEWCLEANSLAIQVMGGAGYTRDYLAEQYWRDQRLNMIHEGTHGIQALDLLGRKVRIRDGALLRALERRVLHTCERAVESGLAEESRSLAQAWAAVLAATDAAWATNDPQDALANATPYMQGFGHVVMAWIHLDLAVTASSSSHAQAGGRLAAMRYFFAYELPKVGAWLEVASRRESVCRDVAADDL